MSIVLGLDLGSNSVGWALVDTEDETIVGMGVRIFPDAVEAKNTEKEHSKNVERRLKRQLRRQYERRRMRTYAVRGILFKAGLLPTEPDAFSDVLMMDPYELRGRALTSELTPFEIGRIVDHINSRRGYQSNRKTTSDEETSGTIYEGTADGTKAGINQSNDALNPALRKYKTYLKQKSELLEALPDADDGFRTIGEYLASLDPHEQRRRNRFMLRDHYRIELDLVLAFQARFRPEILKPELQAKIARKVFFQRPLKSVRHQVGPCQFETAKKRCHRSHPEFQRFRVLHQLSTLRIEGAGRIDDDAMRLTAEEHASLILHVTQSEGTRLKIDNPKNLSTALGWEKKRTGKANLEAINVPTTIRQLYNVLGRTYIEGLTREELHVLWNVLQFAEDAEWLTEWAKKRFNLDTEKAKEFSGIKLEDGYGSLSIKAIRKILPFMEEGMPYHEAVEAAGYSFIDQNLNIEIGDRVPALAPEDARNAIVQRSFAEARRIVNAIVRKWGNPDVIRVETGRELRLPAFKRANIDKNNRRNRAQNDEYRKTLVEEFSIDDPRRADLIKLQLWEEQDYVCMYSGKPIGKNNLFDGTVDVDHILPYSRTLDNGRENKVVCLREINQKKGDLTPMEAINRGVVDKASFEERVANLYKNKKISPSKYRKLLMTPDVFSERYSADETKGFVARQLHDTQFVSRLAVKYFRHVAKKVEPTNGQLTSMLRHQWGLDTVLGELASMGRAIVAPIDEPGRKDRSDHRHHAVDALTVALTSISLVQKLSTLNKSTGNAAEGLRAGRIKVPDSPIAGLRKLAIDSIDAIIVSHRKTRPGRGALHAETLYGRARGRNGEQLHNKGGLPMYVFRKPLSSSLSSIEINNIVDPEVRNLVLQRLRDLGVDVEKNKFKLPEDAFITPIWMQLKNGQRRIIKRVRIYKPSSGMVGLRNDSVYVEPSGNDHIQIVRSPELKKPLWVVDTLLDMATGVVKPSIDIPGGESMTLRIGDLVDIPDKGVYKVQRISGAGYGEIGLYRHNDATGNPTNLLRPKPTTLKGSKLNVSVLGEILSHS